MNLSLGAADLARRSARRGWGVVAAAFGVMFVGFGCTYAFPAFFAPLQDTFGASRAALSLVFSIAAFLYFTVGAISGPLADRFGSRRMCFLGMMLVGIGLFVAADADALWQVYLGFGVGIGVGVGFSYVPSVGAVQRWFVRRRGFASGVAVSGIGVGTLLMPKIAEWLVAGYGWRSAYVILGVFAIVVGGAAALCVDSAPEQRGLLPDGGVMAAGAAATAEGMTLKEAVRSRPFRLLYASFFFLSLGLFMPFVHLTPFAEDRGVPHGTAVTLFALIGVGSTVGRFLIAGLADRLGRRRSFAAMFFGVAVMMGWWLASTSVWQLAVFAIVFGTCYGGFVALAPALLVDYFGSRNASGIIGFSYTGVALGTLLGPPFAGYAFDLFQSYTLPIAVSAGAALVSVALVLATPEPPATA